MRGLRWRLLLLAVVAGSVGVEACQGNNPISPDPTPPGATFAAVKTVLNAKCATGSCHGSATGANGGVFMGGASYYANLTSVPGNDGNVVVNVNTAGQSELLRKPDSNDPLGHSGGKLWSSNPADPSYPDYQLVLLWITSGALNN